LRIHTPKFIDELLAKEATKQGVTASQIVTERLAVSYDIQLPPVSQKGQGLTNEKQP